jgi:hypothetical protein
MTLSVLLAYLLIGLALGAISLAWGSRKDAPQFPDAIPIPRWVVKGLELTFWVILWPALLTTRLLWKVRKRADA